MDCVFVRLAVHTHQYGRSARTFTGRDAGMRHKQLTGCGFTVLVLRRCSRQPPEPHVDAGRQSAARWPRDDRVAVNSRTPAINGRLPGAVVRGRAAALLHAVAADAAAVGVKVTHGLSAVDGRH